LLGAEFYKFKAGGIDYYHCNLNGFTVVCIVGHFTASKSMAEYGKSTVLE
jgi:hypothetical protein